MSVGGSAKTPYHHGNLRRALIDAALELIAEDGIGAFSLRETALRVGVSVTAPYRHFTGREALLAAVAEDGFRALAAAMTARTAVGGDAALARLRSGAYAYVDFALEHPGRYRIMFGGAVVDRTRYPELEAALNEGVSVLRANVEAAQQEGLVRTGELTPMLHAMWFMMHGLASSAIDGQLERGAALREVMDAVMTVVDRGILTAPA